uniref:Sulfotransferase n=1 Tax=Plectus sambesii TaxID=2011161 RepID=A0A914XLM4_9BILA
MIDLVVYAVYLILQQLFAFVQRLYWMATGLSDPPVDTPVRLMSILYRRKRDPEELSRWEDFVAVHHSFAPVSILEGDHWAFYAIDRKFAYFVEMPEPVITYDVQKYPFVYIPYFEFSKCLAVVPLSDMLSWADQLAKRPQPKTVFYTNTARCGSTLFAQMLNHPGTSVCFGESYPMTLLAIGYWEKYWHESEMETLVKAVVTILRKDVPTDQICVLKTASTEVRLVPIMARCLPEVKHVFMFRKGGLDPVERMLTRDKTLQMLLKMFLACPQLSKAFGWLAIGDSKWLRVIPPTNMKEWAAIVYASPYGDYLRNKHLFCLPVVWHKDIIHDTENTLRPIFRELGIPEEKIKDALLCLKGDSQKGTFLSQSVMKDVKATEMTDTIRARLDEFAQVLGVPKDTFE